MQQLENKRAIVTGGSTGLGKGIVKELVNQGCEVTVIARNRGNLQKLKEQIPSIRIVSTDITDEEAAIRLINEINPNILVLNAGARPIVKAFHEQNWTEFSTNWDVDVQGTFYWLKAALSKPLKDGSSVIITSSGAAIQGSALSGGYAGSKAMQWMMGTYLKQEAKIKGLNYNTYAILPMITPNTELGKAGIAGYAKRSGITEEQFVSKLGKPVDGEIFGKSVVDLIINPQDFDSYKYLLSGDGLKPID